MGLLFGGSTPREPEIWTVSEVTGYIRELFEIDFRMQDVQVEGELSNFREARSGHIYFTLKDDQAQLPCVMWRSAAQRLSFNPGDGDAVIIRGRISVYEAGGRYQLYAEQILPAGRGSLAIAFEQLKVRLEAEGLFDPARKQPIPVFPRRIGIVTSADAAALRDILNVLNRRCALVQVLVAPTLVQGVDAPPQIVRALQWLDGRDDIDTIIVARGGGSLEDLWAFNDEQVARAIAAARHPVICGVGHETDFTIADFVADLRAPTPSAAAELAVPDLAEIAGAVERLRQRLQEISLAHLANVRWQLAVLRRELAFLGPQMRLANNRQRLDGLSERLESVTFHRLERGDSRLAVARARLQAVSPRATLARGYAIVRRAEDGVLIRSRDDATAGDRLLVEVRDGAIRVQVEEESRER